MYAAALTNGSAFDGEPAAAVEFTLELNQPLHRLQRYLILLAVEGGEHTRVIIGRGDRRTEAAADRLTDGAAAEVVVTARPGWLGDDLHFTRVSLQFEHRLAAQVALEDERATVG